MEAPEAVWYPGLALLSAGWDRCYASEAESSTRLALFAAEWTWIDAPESAWYAGLALLAAAGYRVYAPVIEWYPR